MLRILPSFRPVRLIRFAAAFCLALCLAAALPARADTDPLNLTPQVQEGFRLVYSMDFDAAVRRFETIRQQHPGDPIATDYLLDAIVFQDLNRQDLLDSTFYTSDGFLTGHHTVTPDAAITYRVRDLGNEAIDEATAELEKNPNDVNALFARGWAHSLQATYSGMALRAFGAGLHQALNARTDCARVLELDPRYTDAKLVVGVYDYVVGALPFAFKIFIGIVGIHGSKAQGMAMLRDDAANGSVTRVAAKTAMMLFLRRDGQYAEAATIAHGLALEYPHGFLFQLEEANLQKDGGQGMVAVATYQRLIDLAHRPGYFHAARIELAYYGLGEALRGQARYPQAVAAYRAGADQAGVSAELRRRCLLKAGETLDLMRDHSQAEKEYEAVMQAGGAGTVQGQQAERYLRSGYTGN